VLEDQFPLGRPLQPLDAGIAPLLAQGGHKALGGDDSSPGPLEDTRFNQGGDAGPEVRRNGLLAVGQVQDQQVVGIERRIRAA
jgi:hypothetical protein